MGLAPQQDRNAGFVVLGERLGEAGLQEFG